MRKINTSDGFDMCHIENVIQQFIGNVVENVSLMKKSFHIENKKFLKKKTYDEKNEKHIELFDM